MAIYKRKKSKLWWIDITSPSGERIRCSAKTQHRRQAQELHDKMKAELWRTCMLNEKMLRSWEEAIVRWAVDKAHKKDLPRDIDKARWLDSILGPLRLYEINEDHIMEIIDLKRDDGVSNETINRYLAFVQSVLRRAQRVWKWVDHIPYIEALPESAGRMRYLSHKEAAALLDALPPHYRQAARFALATGLRQSNVLRLEWCQIDEARRTATFSQILMKNKAPLCIPLNLDAMDVLMACKGDHDQYVFTNEGNPFFSIDSRLWAAALKEVGLTDFRWHDLRHTWASWHRQAGTSLEDIQELGGWKTYSMVQRYAHINVEDLRGPANRISLPESPAPRQNGPFLRLVK